MFGNTAFPLGTAPCDMGRASFSSHAPGAHGASGSSTAEGAPLAGKHPTSAGRQPDPRVVTTGRKLSTLENIDQSTGESIEFVPVGQQNVKPVRHLSIDDTRDPSAAFIDAMAFSVVPPDEESFPWVIAHMRRFMDIESLEHRKGLFGFKFSARFGDGAGVIAWGGESQRGRVFFSLMGKGCAMVRDWQGLHDWLGESRAQLKRADVAYDDFDGKVLSIPWAVQQYKDDGFTAGGRRPSHTCMGDWLEGDDSTKGRTLAIGNRESGKYARIYEKGKQLGAALSRWTRFEVEWRAQDRFIPLDILTRPGHYLAGAYPCMAFLAEVQSVIKTIAKGAQIAFDAAVENTKRACGRMMTLMLDVYGGDYAEVVETLMRPGYPARIDPFSYHVKRNPSMLDRSMQGVPA